MRVYVAGSISAPNILEALRNLRIGIRVCAELIMEGYNPFCPFLDHQLFFQLRGDEHISVEQIQAYSMAWLEVSDALYVLPNSENSLGTQKEIARARDLHIPIFYSKQDLLIEKRRIVTATIIPTKTLKTD